MAQASNDRFTVEQRKSILAEATDGKPVTQICKDHNISATTFYKWKGKYAGSEKKQRTKTKTTGWSFRRKDNSLEVENARLKDALLNLLLERVETSMVQR